MRKNELISVLSKLHKIEEKGVNVYVMHLDNVLFLSDFSASDQSKVRGLLDTLKKDSLEHKESFERILEKVRKEERDVY